MVELRIDWVKWRGRRREEREKREERREKREERREKRGAYSTSQSIGSKNPGRARRIMLVVLSTHS